MIAEIRNLQFRDLQEGDGSILFQWKNDPETRQNSSNSQPVSMDTHQRWFEEVIAKPDGEIFKMALLGDTPVGFVRTAKREDGSIECHYIVAPVHRRQGIGKAMVWLFVAIELHSRRIVLPIKKGNTGAERIAARFNLKPGPESPTDNPDLPLVDWISPSAS